MTNCLWPQSLFYGLLNGLEEVSTTAKSFCGLKLSVSVANVLTSFD